MTTYTMTGPDGKDYSIDGPSGATQQQVAAQMAAAHGGLKARSPSGAQPTMMQTLAASPIGRIVHDVVVAPIESAASGLSKIDPTEGAFGLPGPNAVAPAVSSTQQSYANAIDAQHNRPGYAQARVQADALLAKKGGSGLTDQVMSGMPFVSLPGLAGAAGGLAGLFGGTQSALNASNATADSQAAAQAAYAAKHPVSSTVARLSGGLMGVPPGLAQAVPTYAGDNATLTKLASAPIVGPLPRNPASIKQVVPTIADLKASAKAAYTAVDNSGLVVSGPSYDAMVSGLKGKLDKIGIDPSLHPDATAAFNRLDQERSVSAGGAGPAAPTALPFQKLNTLREIAGDAAGAVTPRDSMRANVIQNHIDDYVNNLSPSDLVGGNTNPTQTVDALNDARDLWSRASQAQTIQTAIDKAGIKAGQYSQSGTENALRTQFRQLALNDRQMKRLNPNVQQAVKDVAAGSPIGNILRAVGKYAPHGPVATLAGMGVGTMLGGVGGAAEGGLASLAIPAIGEAARTGATAMTTAAAQRALASAALGRKNALPRLSTFPLQLPSITARSAVPYGLFGSMLNQKNQEQPPM